MLLPATAGAAIVSVEPYVEPPSDDPFGSCSRYMICPPDMVVFTAAAGEGNQLLITVEAAPQPRHRFILRDQWALVQAGPGCAQIDPQAAACTAGTIGTVQLGDSEDWFASSFGGGEVFGDEGRDVLQRRIGLMDGGEGDDVLVGDTGDGGAGDDVLVGATGDGGAGADLLLVNSGFGGSGDDALSCPPQGSCYLEGGPGDDLLTGGPGPDRLFGRRGDDVLRGGSDFDRLRGGLGDDLLAGAAGGDQMHGDAGADRLVSREDRSVGERRVLDRVDCGRGRRDLAVADRRDDVEESCERLALPD